MIDGDGSRALTLRDYQVAARARELLRDFQRKSDDAARRHGLTPQRFLLLLMIKGGVTEQERARLDELAGRMRLSETTVAEIASRAAAAGLVTDADIARLRLTEDGERLLARALAESIGERERLIRGLSDDTGVGAPAR